MARTHRTISKLLSLYLVLVAVTGKEFFEQCPTECKCMWTSGNKGADCSNSTFSEIPKTLSNEVQNLDLSGNGLYEITQHAFENVGLNNLKKLVLRDCKLQTIHKDGFSGLTIMIELDLSNNELRSLHRDTFKHLSKIRWLTINNNSLTKLDDGLFMHLDQLQRVDLSYNRLVQIGMKTFMNVPKLNNIRLGDNRLEHLKVDIFSSVPSLSTLELYNNSWRCDCYLQPFRNWVMSKKLCTTPIACVEPPPLNGKWWSELDSDHFACKPNIIYPTAGTVLRSSDTNITLSCIVSGNPLPEASWVMNSKVIVGSTLNHGKVKYYLSQSSDQSSKHTKWLNLTIVDADGTDDGEYLCAAKNSGGVEERSLTLFVTLSNPGTIVPAGVDSNIMPVLIGISCSAAILLIILAILCYICCCRRKNGEKNKKADTSNGEALIEGSVIPEMEKSLINTINPVTKPPRRYDVPASITSGGTEMSELNKTLLDMDCVYAANDDEKQSLDYDQDPSKRSHEMLNYSRQDGRAYPPDLLSFPARAPQISPAASSASTVPDTTRLPTQLNPVSPIHSPIYSVNQNLFRTLPYSRSQSPFTAPITPPVITPRQGYVTIPRRPRVPSWSSTASTQIMPSTEAQEPLYDNLGLRTTADGSSVLSLNKAGLEQQLSPMRGRPLPATPVAFQNPHQVYYAPIEEQEPAPSPVPSYYSANPRNSVTSQLSSQFSTPGPQEPVNLRMSWTAKNASTPQKDPRNMLYNGNDISNRNSVDMQPHVAELNTLSRKGNKPETGSLRRNPRGDIKDSLKSPKSSPVKEDLRSDDGNISLNLSGTLGRSGKIPPRPPPKPKKKPSVDSIEPAVLFEDEGEDGTEV